ncbi:I78 family peptidase inhibitor [Stutzerimonas nitrititolerans]|uniref:I78 family peptidase inhibitor n=1 Tax=Stutzerimonas nitrititolerans TaxID=2482751 RepID=UPI0028A8F1E8|nr:I78 family peptidase inhibitor [Stutzerimonas nitrititolerans]
MSLINQNEARAQLAIQENFMHVVSATATLLLASLALLGCQQSQPQTQTPSTRPGSCNAEAVQNLVGKTASPALLEQAREQSGAQTARVLRPQDVVTLEYNAQRLNLSTDGGLVIQRINCG